MTLDRGPRGEVERAMCRPGGEHSTQREQSVQMLHGGKCLDVFEAQNKGQRGWNPEGDGGGESPGRERESKAKLHRALRADFQCDRTL